MAERWHLEIEVSPVIATDAVTVAHCGVEHAGCQPFPDADVRLVNSGDGTQILQLVGASQDELAPGDQSTAYLRVTFDVAGSYRNRVAVIGAPA